MFYSIFIEKFFYQKEKQASSSARDRFYCNIKYTSLSVNMTMINIITNRRKIYRITCGLKSSSIIHCFPLVRSSVNVNTGLQGADFFAQNQLTAMLKKFG